MAKQELKPTNTEEIIASSGAELTHPYTPTPTAEEAEKPRRFVLRGPNPIKYLRRLPFFAYLIVLGPGVVSAAAGNDAGGIATYAQAGATYGYNFLWTMLVIGFSLSLVQEMCARMGAVTGKGLSDLIREQFGAAWALFAVLVLLIANTGVTISEFVGIAAAAELFGIPTWLAVPPIAVLVWWLITGGSYKTVEKVFMLLSLVFFAYIVAVFLAPVDWAKVGNSYLHPTISLQPSALQALVALIGTTISPYMQLFVQSSVVEKGVTPRDYKYTRFDTVFGVILSSIISICIIIATAAALNAHGITQVNSATDAAKALEPVAGQSATILFGLGLFGASMLAAGVLPLATAFSVTESLGFEKGVSLSFREAPVFMGLFTALVAIGAIVAMIPGLPLFAVLIGVYVLNGVLLPILLVFIVRLASNREIMGKYAIGPVYRFFAWAIVVLISIAVVLMLGTMFIQ
jgi:NRAMP (natural resistance-associated macrophage protein)-like metal ion transporter